MIHPFLCLSLKFFQVPLNYSAPISSSNNGSIAIIRIPSLHTPTSQDYKGPILFNPGGPGDSGVDFMLTDGNLLRTIVGNSFDVVSFDPRGMRLFDHSRRISLIRIFQAFPAPFQPRRSSATTLIETYGLPGHPSSISSILQRTA